MKFQCPELSAIICTFITKVKLLHVKAAMEVHGSASAQARAAGALLVVGPNCLPRNTRYICQGRCKIALLHCCHSDVMIRHEVNGLRAIINDNLSKHMEGLSVRLCLYLLRSQTKSNLNTLVADRVSPTFGGCFEQESRRANRCHR